MSDEAVPCVSASLVGGVLSTFAQSSSLLDTL